MKTQTNRPNFDLLRDAFEIIDGIPESAFALDWWTVEQGKSLSCGTIACAGGWLARHPKFKALGLHIDGGGNLCGNNNDDNGFGALSALFNLDEVSGEDSLFSNRDFGYKDHELAVWQMCNLSDKRLWKRRVLRLFQEYGEPFDKKVGRGLHLNAREGQCQLST